MPIARFVLVSVIAAFVAGAADTPPTRGPGKAGKGARPDFWSGSLNFAGAFTK